MNEYMKKLFNEHDKETFMNHVTNELNLLGVMDADVTKSMVQTLDKVFDIAGGDPQRMKLMLDLMYRLIQYYPISPIYEHELKEVYGEVVHPRYPYIQKVDFNQYVDTRAVGFINKYGHKFYGTDKGFTSVAPVEFPYYPNEKIVYNPDNE